MTIGKGVVGAFQMSFCPWILRCLALNHNAAFAVARGAVGVARIAIAKCNNLRG
jgi:hypothetical protein